MTCFRPLDAARKSGSKQRPLIFKKGQRPKKLSAGWEPMQLACGRCIGCRLEKAKDWAIRCSHEAQMWDENTFITLTYNDENLPEDKSLNVHHFQKFLKRLRKTRKYEYALDENGKKYVTNPIRFLHCGEYGETCPKHDIERCEICGPIQRPHYHAILFNHEFDDQQPWKLRNGIQTYLSENLTNLWGKGNTEIGTVTFQSAAYVARYATKKITGDNAHAHYEKLNENTGEVYWVKPEYITMSRRPGLGKKWYDKYKDDLFPEDECVIDGRVMKPPRYYTQIYEREEPEEYKRMIETRKRFFEEHKGDSTSARLDQREKVKRAQASQLTRRIK